MINKNDIIRIAIEEKVPLHKILGLKVESLSEDKIILKLPFSEKVLGDVRSNRWHGGVISMVMDVVGGLCGIVTFTSLEDKLTTIDLRIDYLDAPLAQELWFKGETVRLGNKILVSRIKAYHPNNSKVFAEGKGVYYIKRDKY